MPDQKTCFVVQGFGEKTDLTNVRREVTRYCEQALAAGVKSPEDEHWLLATLWEASVGLDDASGAAKWKQEAERRTTAVWMLESTKLQIAALEKLLAASPLKL